MKIAPSILSADFSNLLKDIKNVEDANADYLHIDVMDGHFVPNISIGPIVVKSLKNKTKIPFDVHLMIDNPDYYITEFVKAGAKIITVHKEACLHLDRTLQLIHSFGIKASVALNPSTPLDALNYILQEVDMVLLMTVNPGFGGQRFIEYTYDKIKDLYLIRKKRNLNFKIEVDGGISIDNIKKVLSCGADLIVAGSAIFGNGDPKENIFNLREAAK